MEHHTSYSEYSTTYQQVEGVLSAALKQTDFHKLEEATVRFLHAIECGTIKFERDEAIDFLQALLAKAANEAVGLLGCLRAGALNAAYHHTRALWELLAAGDYIYADGTKKTRRLQKFNQYQFLNRYLHYKHCSAKLLTNEISADDFERECPITAAEFVELETRVQSWRKIWGLKSTDSIDKIRNWHHPAVIENLFDHSINAKSFKWLYTIVCHATHLSPLGSRLAGGLFIIGFPQKKGEIDVDRVNSVIHGGLLALQKFAVFLSETANVGHIEGIVEIDFDPPVPPERNPGT